MSGINYAECDEGYVERPNNDGTSSGTRKIRCAWDDRVALTSYILSENTVSVAGITIDVGSAHPSYPQWYAMGAAISPVTEKREQAYIEIAYKPLEFDPTEPALIREDRLGLANEVIPLAAHSVKFGDGTKADNEEDFLLTYMTYKVTLKNVTTVPMSAVLNCLNKVHSGTMTLRVGATNLGSCPGDQVLYQGIDDIVVGYTSAGVQRFDLTHNFLIAPIGLNKMYNPNSLATDVFARFETVTPSKYLTANFTTLGV
jgi:hypothetical protein